MPISCSPPPTLQWCHFSAVTSATVAAAAADNKSSIPADPDTQLELQMTGENSDTASTSQIHGINLQESRHQERLQREEKQERTISDGQDVNKEKRKTKTYLDLFPPIPD
ncbi:unnamed protein product, partial [Amoebophrya sp. A120]|eukprot:GSA120T00007629001.1